MPGLAAAISTVFARINHSVSSLYARVRRAGRHSAYLDAYLDPNLGVAAAQPEGRDAGTEDRP